jgi:hypothetical protein
MAGVTQPLNVQSLGVIFMMSIQANFFSASFAFSRLYNLTLLYCLLKRVLRTPFLYISFRPASAVFFNFVRVCGTPLFYVLWASSLGFSEYLVSVSFVILTVVLFSVSDPSLFRSIWTCILDTFGHGAFGESTHGDTSCRLLCES